MERTDDLTDLESARVDSFYSREQQFELLDRIKKLLARLTYKEGTTFSATKSAFGPDIVFSVTLTVPDALGRQHKAPHFEWAPSRGTRPDDRVINLPKSRVMNVPLRLKQMVPMSVLLRWSDKEVLDEIEQWLIQLETHEVHEFFKVDGKHHVDPHPEIPAP